MSLFLNFIVALKIFTKKIMFFNQIVLKTSKSLFSTNRRLASHCNVVIVMWKVAQTEVETKTKDSVLAVAGRRVRTSLQAAKVFVSTWTGDAGQQLESHADADKNLVSSES